MYFRWIWIEASWSVGFILLDSIGAVKLVSRKPINRDLSKRARKVRGRRKMSKRASLERLWAAITHLWGFRHHDVSIIYHLLFEQGTKSLQDNYYYNFSSSSFSTINLTKFTRNLNSDTTCKTYLLSLLSQVLNLEWRKGRNGRCNRILPWKKQKNKSKILQDWSCYSYKTIQKLFFH